MFRSCLVCCLLLVPGFAATAQAESSADPVVSTYVVRTAVPLQAPHRLTYRLAEFSQQRGRWIVPDIGIYDSSTGKDKLLFAGAGADFRFGRKVDYTQIFYIAQDVGPGSHGARTFWIWPVLDADLSRRWMTEVVLYPSIPLNRAAQAAFDIDRAKLQYAFDRRISLGAGYSSTIYEGSTWANKPFLTATVFSRAGSFEFWLQRIPEGGQVQVRYTLIHADR